MLEIKKIKKIPAANIIALLYAAFGFIASFTTSIYSLVLAVAHHNVSGKAFIYISTNVGLGFLIALAVAVIAAVFGWLLGIIGAAFYNFISKNIGGIKIELADEASQVLVFKTEEKKQELFKY
jgi:hypothetical protein